MPGNVDDFAGIRNLSNVAVPAAYLPLATDQPYLEEHGSIEGNLIA